MTPGTQMIRRDVITEVVSCRNAAVDSYNRYFLALEEAQSHREEAEGYLAQAIAGQSVPSFLNAHVPELLAFEKATEVPNRDRLERVARRLVDLRIWVALVGRTDLEALMDATAKDELRKQLAYIPEEVDPYSGQLLNQAEIDQGIPQVTEENVIATLESFRERSAMIWRRGIATCFSKLSREFRSHNGVKFGNRVVLNAAMGETGNWQYGRSWQRDRIIDVERVFWILDGRSPRGFSVDAGIVGIIERERGHRYAPIQSEHVGEFFRAKIYRNGNVHLWFTRKDLLDKVNLELAAYYGAGLGWGKASVEEPDAEFDGATSRMPARNLGFYPTPEKLVDRVLDEAYLYSDSPLSILEPSAGTGALALPAATTSEKRRHRVTCVELDSDRARLLESHGCYARVINRDFLTMPPDPRFDRVIMNPPFDRLRDVDHVHHAIKFLKPGGRLVAIMSASAEFSQERKAVAFRNEVKSLGGRLFDLPERSFAEYGTNVNTARLVLTKGK